MNCSAATASSAVAGFSGSESGAAAASAPELVGGAFRLGAAAAAAFLPAPPFCCLAIGTALATCACAAGLPGVAAFSVPVDL